MNDSAAPDVVIIGAGIAGSSLAIILSRAGLAVHMMERASAFRDRIRGEVVHPWGVRHLRQVGLLDLAVNRAGAQVHAYWQRYVEREPQEAYRWADDFPESPHGLGVRHTALQEALLDEAVASGVTVHRPAEAQFSGTPDRPSVEISSANASATLTPRLLVGADGESSATRQWMGGTSSLDPMHHMLGGVLVDGLGIASDRIHQAFFEGGFCFASPVSAESARVYMVCDPQRAMAIQRSGETGDAIVERFRSAMPEGTTGDDWRLAGPAGFFPNSTQVASIPSSAATVLIGDASGRNDPSQGHGLSLVFRDVETLSAMLLGNTRWEAIPNEFHAAKARDFEVLRQHARWNERTATETGPDIDAVREGIARSRAADPTAGGFAGIFGNGPAGLVADEAAERHYFGLDLDS